MKRFIFFSASFLLMIIPMGHARVNVVSTIGQITDVVKNIGGEHVEAIGLMGPGVDPHLYKASESDVNKLSNAEIIFYNGLYLEAKMESLFERMSRSTLTVPVGESVNDGTLLSSIAYPDHHDPHIWFDVQKWIRVAQKISQTLQEFDSEHAIDYQNNLEIYVKKLEELEAYVLARAQELPKEKRLLVTAHDAFRYFGNAYDFQVEGLQGISTEAEASTKDVIQLANFITEKKVKALFVESSVPERNIRAVQDAVKSRGWDVVIGGSLFSDAMGDAGTFEGTYIGMVTHNIDTIVEALK